MSPVFQPTDTVHIRFPRVSGDEPQAKPGDLSALLFSPRERG